MRARVTRSFRWSPDGIAVVTIEAGTVVEGRAAQVAVESFGGVPLDERHTAALEGAPIRAAVTDHTQPRRGRRKR